MPYPNYEEDYYPEASCEIGFKTWCQCCGGRRYDICPAIEQAEYDYYVQQAEENKEVK